MANHRLSLEIPETLDSCYMTVGDTSTYNEMADVVCPRLYVTPPGFNQPAVLEDEELPQGFNKVLTACDLDLQSSGCGSTFNSIPDGIYIVKYAVSPHDVVYVEYNHLRRTEALNKWNNALCNLDMGACDPDDLLEKKLDDLNMIKMYLDAAKAKVEICHEPNKGMELYKYAVKLLGKFDCSSCQGKTKI